jgi:hypothetical protein
MIEELSLLCAVDKKILKGGIFSENGEEIMA